MRFLILGLILCLSFATASFAQNSDPVYAYEPAASVVTTTFAAEDNGCPCGENCTCGPNCACNRPVAAAVGAVARPVVGLASTSAQVVRGTVQRAGEVLGNVACGAVNTVQNVGQGVRRGVRGLIQNRPRLIFR